MDCAASFNLLHFIDAAWLITIGVLLVVSRLAPRVRDWAERVSRRRFAQAFIVGSLLVLVQDALHLPAQLYGHHRFVVCGGSVQGWGSWLWDWGTSESITLVVNGFAIWILYGALRRAPRRWWFYFWLVAVGIVTFMEWIGPVIINPLFYRFDPLQTKHPELVAQLQNVAAHGGVKIPADRIFTMNASTKWSGANAQVTGFGSSARVAIFDTMIARTATPELLFLFGHELGHYVLHHRLKSVAVTCASLLVFFFWGDHAMRWGLFRWGKQLGVHGMADWASLPLLMLAFSIFTFLDEPVQNSFSRTMEHEADVYGLEIVHGILPDSRQTSAQALRNLESGPPPSPFIRIWLYDHPPIDNRIRFALEYDPWAKGQAPKYVK